MRRRKNYPRPDDTVTTDALGHDILIADAGMYKGGRPVPVVRIGFIYDHHEVWIDPELARLLKPIIDDLASGHSHAALQGSANPAYRT